MFEALGSPEEGYALQLHHLLYVVGDLVVAPGTLEMKLWEQKLLTAVM